MNRRKYYIEYYKRNKEKISNYGKRHYKKNQKRILQRQAVWYQNNKEKRLKYYTEYRQLNREKINEWSRNWRKNNIEKARENVRKNHFKMRKIDKESRLEKRIEALTHYGGNPPNCKCCGEKEIKFLAFDHINGGGVKHRKERKGGRIEDWLRSNNYPEGFQVLCHNCNLAKGFYGNCPHHLSQGEHSLKEVIEKAGKGIDWSQKCMFTALNKPELHDESECIYCTEADKTCDECLGKDYDFSLNDLIETGEVKGGEK